MVTGPSLASLVTVQPEVGRRFAFLLPRNSGQLAVGVLVMSVQPTLSLHPPGPVAQPSVHPGPLPSSPLGAQALVLLPSHCPTLLVRSSAEGLIGELLFGSGVGWLSVLCCVPVP